MNVKVTPDQKDILLSFLKDKPEMFMGKFTPQFSRADCKGLWEELATILNAIPNGASKDWCGWRKTWIDIKKYSKAKLAVIKKHQAATGGGPPMDPPKNKLFDDKIFEMLTPVTVTGNENVPEPILVEEVETEDTNLLYHKTNDSQEQEQDQLKDKENKHSI